MSQADMNRPLKCVKCVQGKSNHQNFKKIPNNTKEITLCPDGLIYSDTCSPFSVPDINGNNYYQNFIDDYTRLTVTFLMKTKTETLRNLEIYVAFMRARNYSVRTFRTDQDTEYASSSIQCFLRFNSITYFHTNRSAHTQIHVVERMHRTLTDMARKMLLDAVLP